MRYWHADRQHAHATPAGTPSTASVIRFRSWRDYGRGGTRHCHWPGGIWKRPGAIGAAPGARVFASQTHLLLSDLSQSECFAQRKKEVIYRVIGQA